METQLESYANLMQNSLALRLKKVHITRLMLVEMLKHDAYTYKDGQFEIELPKDSGISIDFIKNYAQENGHSIFISLEDFDIIQEKLKEQLLKVTRSLSIGDPLKNGAKHANLLTMQMADLYDDPFNDELLASHFQSSKNLSALLYHNKKIQKSLYHHMKRQSHHYTHIQPLLSSILLLAFLQHTNLFNEKEISNLFLTSYFKDIGMSFVPREKLELAHLNDFEKKIFSDHATHSLSILEGRVPLNKTNLNMIANHHFLNYIIQAKASGRPLAQDAELLTGVESMILSAIDILVAMTSDRPYREKISVYRALEFLKKVVSDEYPQEFRSLVIFIKRFFST